MDIMPNTPVWYIYLGLLIGPFIQEDAAVFTAAGLAVNEPRQTLLMALTVFVGLFFSDAWKYWIGRFALRNEKARAFTEKKHVSDLKDKVERNLALTLISIRFIPFGRIPTYAACGFFKVSYIKYCFFIALSALIYVCIVFTTIRVLGELMGERLHWMLPIIALTVVLIIIVGQYIKRRLKSRSKDISELKPDNT